MQNVSEKHLRRSSGHLYNWCRSTRQVGRSSRQVMQAGRQEYIGGAQCSEKSRQVQQPSGAGSGAPSGAVIALVLPAVWFSSRLQCYTALFRPLEGSAGGLLSGSRRPRMIEK